MSLSLSLSLPLSLSLSLVETTAALFDVTLIYLFVLELNFNLLTVELRWLEPLWNHENLFEIWVVWAIGG